jgi:2-methylcitrate dehydratase
MRVSSELIAEYALVVSIDDLPADVVEQTKRLVLDSVGCCVGAYASPPSKILRDVYGDRTATENGGTIIGTDATVLVEYAALINGAMVRYLDYNDCYISGSSVCHPSDHIPALLAVGESENASGEELVEAIVVAYEIQCAGIDAGVIWDNGFDYVTWGGFSSVAAVGKLMGLSTDELISAVGIVGASSNGLLVSRLGSVSMWKGLAQPYATHNAVQACQMAQQGLTGPAEVFEGDGGFFEVVSEGPVEFDHLGGRNGASYRVMRTNFKPFACGYFMQAPITALLSLVEEQAIDPSDVTSIEIEEFAQAVQVLADSEKWSTDLNRETADHSIPYTVAIALLDGAVTPDQYSEAHLTDPCVHELMQKVSVTESEDLTRRRSKNPGLIPARVRVETDADTHEIEIDYPDGHWKQPLDDERLEGKFTDLTTPYLTTAQIERAIDACSTLESTEDLSDIVESVMV